METFSAISSANCMLCKDKMIELNAKIFILLEKIRLKDQKYIKLKNMIKRNVSNSTEDNIDLTKERAAKKKVRCSETEKCIV